MLDTSGLTDVLIIGAGPCGLTLAGFLAARNIQVVVVDARPELIDYPRGVGLDDESLRTFQSLGVVDDVLAHVVSNQKVIYVDAQGRELARMAPKVAPFGWPRRNGFIQPAVDEVLLDHLQRRDAATVLWAHEVVGLTESADRVTAKVTTPDGPGELSARYVVGCDGGRSLVRKHLGVSFDGLSSSTSWLVVDLEHDPVGTPNTIVGCDPRRPYISIGLPQGIRRFEFMLREGEGEEMSEPTQVHNLIRQFVDDAADAEVLRARVYTHHARVAGRFVDGRILLAGDAAHLMPVWQGQGYNTAIRDAANLWWKLAYVVRGAASPELLQSYDAERRPHATAMVRLSEITGRFLSPTNRSVAAVRNGLSRSLSVIPRVKSYVMEARFKPMPTYTDGAVVDPGNPVVGRLLVQPRVSTTDRSTLLLDDVIGPNLAVLQWGSDPTDHLSKEVVRRLDELGTQYIRVVQTPTDARRGDADTSTIEITDVDAGLRAVFDEIGDTVIFVRPDRIVAATCQPQHATRTAERLLRVLAATSV